MQEACNTLQLSWTSSDYQVWDILIRQIPCTAEYRPPDSCLQYFTGTSGTIYSYNYAGSQHLANHKYSNCIRSVVLLSIIDSNGLLSAGQSKATAVSATLPAQPLISRCRRQPRPL